MLASIIVGGIVLIILLVIYLEYRNEKKYQEERQRQKERKKKKLTPKVTKRPAPSPAKRSEAKVSPPIAEEKKKELSSKQESTDVQPGIPKVKTKAAPTTVQPEKTREPVKKPDNDELKSKKETLQPDTVPVKAPLEKKTKAPEKKEHATRVQPTTAKHTEPPKKESETAVELPKGEYPAFNYERLIEMGLSEAEAHEFIQELIPQIEAQIPLIQEAMDKPDYHQMERLTHSIKGSSTTIGTGGVSDLLVDYNTYLKEGKEVEVLEAYQKHLKHYFEALKKQFPKD